MIIQLDVPLCMCCRRPIEGDDLIQHAKGRGPTKQFHRDCYFGAMSSKRIFRSERLAKQRSCVLARNRDEIQKLLAEKRELRKELEQLKVDCHDAYAELGRALLKTVEAPHISWWQRLAAWLMGNKRKAGK